MDYLKNATRKTVGSQELIFVRCDKDGNEIPEEKFRELSVTNSTIERIVTEAAGRIPVEPDAAEGIYTQGITTA